VEGQMSDPGGVCVNIFTRLLLMQNHPCVQDTFDVERLRRLTMGMLGESGRLGLAALLHAAGGTAGGTGQDSSDRMSAADLGSVVDAFSILRSEGFPLVGASCSS
jgi:hypothetical protein